MSTENPPEGTVIVLTHNARLTRTGAWAADVLALTSDQVMYDRFTSEKRDPVCSRCNASYPEGGDGWNGECPECADRTFRIDSLQAAVDAVMALSPEDHATKSRDYGRGFAEAIRLVRDTIEKEVN